MAVSVAPYLNRVSRLEIAGIPIGKALLLGSAMGVMDAVISLVTSLADSEKKFQVGGVHVTPLAVGAGAAVAFNRVRQVGDFLGDDGKAAFVLASLLEGADKSIAITDKVKGYLAYAMYKLGMVDQAAQMIGMPPPGESEQGKGAVESRIKKLISFSGALEAPISAPAIEAPQVEEPVEEVSVEAPVEAPEIGSIPAGAGIANIEARLRSIRLPS